MAAHRKTPLAVFLFLVLFSVVFSTKVRAEPTITFELPTIIGGDGEIERSLEASLEGFIESFRDELNERLDKPDVLTGFARASSVAPLTPHALYFSSPYSAFIGFDAAVYAPPLSTSIDRASDIDEDSDEMMGGSMQPLSIRLRFPLDMVRENLFAGFSCGYLSVESGDFAFDYYTIGISSGLVIGGWKDRLASWDGLSLHGGIDYSHTVFSALHDPGQTSRQDSFDPDGSGGIPTLTASYTVDPQVSAAFTLSSGSLVLQASTGVTLVELFSFSCGLGLSLSRVGASLSIDAEEEIRIGGTLADYIEGSGSVAVHGEVVGVHAWYAQMYLHGAMEMRLGSLVLSFPVIWVPETSLACGLYAGVRF